MKLGHEIPRSLIELLLLDANAVDLSSSVLTRVDHRLYDTPEADAGIRGSLPEPIFTQATCQQLHKP